MKIVNYLGQDYEVPDHANFIAADWDGELCWFEHEPTIFADIGWAVQGVLSTYGRIGFLPAQYVAYPLLKI